MTRDEFVNNPPETISDLIDFCEEYELNACEDIISDSSLDDFVEDDVREFLRHDYWYNLWPLLRDIPTGYSWYVRSGQLEYYDAEEDVDTYVEYTIGEMDRRDLWDDEQDEDDGEEYEEDEEEDEAEAREEEECFCAFSVDVFIGDSASSVTAVRQKGEELARKKEEADREYRTFVIKAEADEKKREEEAFSENRAAFETLILR